jgi:hypothetical protein
MNASPPMSQKMESVPGPSGQPERCGFVAASASSEPAAPVIPPRGVWPLQPGEVYTLRFPFKRGEFDPYPDYEDPASGALFCAPKKQPTWVPGWDGGADQYGEHQWCDGWGLEVRAVVGVFRPGHYPERCFYTRSWQDPDGRVFGRKGLRVIPSRDFRSWARGSRYRFLRIRNLGDGGHEPSTKGSA